LGLPEFKNIEEMVSRLISEYWTHIEYFPMHLAVLKEAEDMIMVILRHGCVDNMTSPGSTFPFGEVECRQYLSVLEGFKDSTSPKTFGYRNAVIARIWNAIARARHINSWGVDGPRLDRLQGVAEFSQSQIKDSPILAIGELCTFHLSKNVFKKLSSMWNGRVVYQRHWHSFFQDMRIQWRRMAELSIVIWLGNCTLVASGLSSVCLAGSMAISGSSIFISVALIYKHSEQALANGPDVSRYIMSVESYHHGLRPTAIVYVLPHALTAYSAILINVALVGMVMEGISRLTDGLIVVFALILSILLSVGTLSFFGCLPYRAKKLHLASALAPLKKLFSSGKGSKGNL